MNTAYVPLVTPYARVTVFMPKTPNFLKVNGGPGRTIICKLVKTLSFMYGYGIA